MCDQSHIAAHRQTGLDTESLEQKVALGDVEMRIELGELHLSFAALAVGVVEQRAGLRVVDQVIVPIACLASDMKLAWRQGQPERREDRLRKPDSVLARVEVDDRVDVGRLRRMCEHEGIAAPAAGTETGAAPPMAAATASALPPPETISQTSRERAMAGSVKVIRCGGGLGESSTDTTMRVVSSTAGVSGNSELM